MSAAPNMVAVDAKPMMKALCFSAHGKPAVSVLSMMDVPRPVTAPAGCVLVKVMAAALNPIDAIRVEGGLKLLRKEAAFPAVLGYDLAGVIESVGEGVTGFSVGDEIAARMQNEPHPGSIAEFALVEARTLAKKAKRSQLYGRRVDRLGWGDSAAGASEGGCQGGQQGVH